MFGQNIGIYAEAGDGSVERFLLTQKRVILR